MREIFLVRGFPKSISYLNQFRSLTRFSDDQPDNQNLIDATKPKIQIISGHLLKNYTLDTLDIVYGQWPLVILDIVYISLGIKWSWSFEYIHWNEQYKTLCIHNCGQWEKLWEDKGRFTKNTKSPEMFEIFWRKKEFSEIFWNFPLISAASPCVTAQSTPAPLQ